MTSPPAADTADTTDGADDAGDAGTSVGTAPARTAAGRPWLLLAAIVLVALNLRTAITAVPPLVERIGAELGLSRSWTGALTTLPVLCMGVFAPLAQRLAHRFGRESAVMLAAVALVLGSALRLGGDHVALLYLGTFVAGFGIAVAGTLLPGVVKEHFPARAGLMTGAYMLAMMSGATLASALTVPLADALGSWPGSLASWALPALLGAVAWLPVARAARSARQGSAEPEEDPTLGRVRLPWRHRTAWLVAAYLAVQSWQFYSQLAWIAPTYEDRGWSPTRAGLLLAVFSATQILSGVAGPVLADRVPDRRAILLPSVLSTAVGLAGVLLAPELAPWVWVGLLGLGLGSGFAMGLVLLVDYSATPAASARLSAMVFLVSYSTAALGPIVLGFLRDLTGGFTVPFALLLALIVPQLVTAWLLRPGRPRTP